MPEDQDRAESPGLEEELPTPLNNGSVDQHAADQQNIRSTSPPKRSAAHMENDEDADMRETTEVDSTGPATGRNNGTSNGSSHQIPRSTEMHTNDQMLDCTTATNSVDSDPTSASAQSSSAATSLGSSPFHMSAPTEDRVLESNGDLAERPSYDEQYQRVLQMMMEPPQDGDVGFLVASKWLMRVMARTSSPPDGLDKEALEGEIGPVDNSSILQPDMPSQPLSDQNGEPFVPLKPEVTKENYEIMPDKAWNLVKQWYGLAPGSFEIKRYAHDTAEPDSTGTNVIYELNPPVFTIRKIRNEKEGLTKSMMDEKQASAPKLMAPRSKGTQDFLRQVKKAANIPIETKIRLWRDLTSSVQPIQEEPAADQASMMTPPSSNGGSPRMRPQTPPKLLMDLNEFTSMNESDREEVDCKDETANSKYNGRSKIGILGLASDQMLIAEEQTSPGKEEYVSDAMRGNAAKNGVSVNNKAGTNRATAGKSGTQSGRASPAPSGPVTRGRANRTGRTRGTIGLTNLGNTCYMNSALQCIRSVEELTQYFLLDRYKKELNPNNPLGHGGQVAKVYAGFLGQLYEPSATSSFAPRNFKGTLGKYAPMFSGYGQQDSQEFMSFLVDALHEDLNRIHKKPYIENPESDDKTVGDPEAIRELGERFRENHRARNDSIAMDLFNGFYKNTMVCPECDKVSVTFDPFSLLTLQLPFEQTWQHTIDFVPLYGQPIKIEVDIDKNSTFRSLKDYIMQRVQGLDRQRLLITEVFNHKFYKIFEDNATISESNVQPRDDIVVYELEDVPTNFPPKKKNPQKIRSMLVFDRKESDDEMDTEPDAADCMLVPVFNQGPGSSTYSSKSLLMWPFFINLTRIEAMDYDTILRKVLAKVGGMTTKDILEGDDHQFRPFTDANESDTVLTPEDDASSIDPAVQAQSLQGEDSIVDVLMTDGNSAVARKFPSNGSATKSLPSVFQPGSFIPAQLQNMFTMRYHMVGSDIIPTGFSSFDSGSRNNETLQSRFPATATDGRRSSLASTASMSQGRSSESDIDDPPQPAHSFQTPEELSDEDLPPIGSLYKQTSQKKKFGKGRKNQATYSRKGKQTSGFSNFSSYDGTEDDDDPALVRLGEIIVLDWDSGALDALFGEDRPDPEKIRGGDARKHAETLPDPALQKKKERRAARKKSGVTLEDCFAETAKGEILSEENAWYCNRCKELRRASKTLEIWTLPDILVVHLKRFGANRGFRDKVDVLVDFPVDELNLNDRVGLTEGKDLTYQLIAVDNHYGGLGGGHYTAFAKNFFDGQWYEYNDSQVSKKTNPQAVVTSAAYLLFYRRKSDKPLGPAYLQKLIADAHAAENQDENGGDARDGAADGKSQPSSRNASPSGQGKGRPLDASFRNGSSSASAGAGAGHRAAGGLAGSEGAGRQARTEAGDATMDDEVLPTYEQSGMDHDFDEGVGGMHEERSALFGQLIGPQLPFNGADIHEQAWGWGRLGNGDVDADADGDADDNDSNRAAGGSSNGDLPDLADRAGDFEDDGLHPLNVSREASPSVGVTHHEVVGQMLHLVDGEPMSEDDPPPADVTVAEHEELKMD